MEIVFALAAGMILLGTIYVAMEAGRRSSVAMERKVASMQDARAALEIMALEIGMASYNPFFASGIWRNASCGASPPAPQQYKGIQEATANSLIIEMDMDDSSAVGDGANEIIRYAYDGGGQYVTRERDCGGAQPFLGDHPASGLPRTVRVINDRNGNGVFDEGDIPLFRYFDGGGNQISFANFPAAIPEIRRIEITLQVETEEIDPNSGQRRRMIYSSSMIPRNHVISP